jgi:O-antigen/teichoic acid export membrane protein
VRERDISRDPQVSVAEDSSSDAARTQIRGSTLLLAGQVFAVLVNLATQIVLVRYLSKTSFGAFAYALAIVSLAETIAALGLRRGVSRFVPIYEERGDLARAAGTLAFAGGTVVGLGLAVVLVVEALRDLIAGAVATEPASEMLLAILILLAPVQAVESLLDGAFAVFARPRAIVARRFVYTPVVRLLVVALLVASDSTVTFLAAGYVAAGGAGVAVYSMMLWKLLARRGLLDSFRRGLIVLPIREVLRFTVPLLTNDLRGVLVNSVGVIVLGVVAGAADAASLRAVLPVSLTLTYVLGAFGTLFVPLASRLYARGHVAELDRLYWQTAGWSAVFSFPVFALAFAFATPLTVALFGERYADAGPVLAALVVGHFATAAVGPNGVLLAVYGHVGYLVWTNIAAIVVNIVLSVTLIWWFGAVGAAIAATGTLLVANTLWQVGLSRRTGVGATGRQYVSLYALMVVLTLALFMIESIVSPPLAVAIVLVTVSSCIVFVYARTQLALAETFPGLLRVPGIGRFLAAGRRA